MQQRPGEARVFAIASIILLGASLGVMCRSALWDEGDDNSSVARDWCTPKFESTIELCCFTYVRSPLSDPSLMLASGANQGGSCGCRMASGIEADAPTASVTDFAGCDVGGVEDPSPVESFTQESETCLFVYYGAGSGAENGRQPASKPPIPGTNQLQFNRDPILHSDPPTAGSERSLCTDTDYCISNENLISDEGTRCSNELELLHDNGKEESENKVNHFLECKSCATVVMTDSISAASNIFIYISLVFVLDEMHFLLALFFVLFCQLVADFLKFVKDDFDISRRWILEPVRWIAHGKSSSNLSHLASAKTISGSVQILLWILLISSIQGATARPNFDRIRSKSAFLRRRAPVSDAQPRRFKEYLREERGSQIIHLKYDVVLAQGTRVLDGMEEVEEINCTTNSLSIQVNPGSDFDATSRQFQIGNVVAGGKEWGCQIGELGAQSAEAFTRRVESVSIEHAPRIVLITSDCTPFEAFSRQDIDIWSEDVAHSANQLRSHKSAVTDPAEISEDNLSTRVVFDHDFVDTDEEWDSTKVLSGEHFLMRDISRASEDCQCSDYSKHSGPRLDPTSVKACEDNEGCTWYAGNPPTDLIYGGRCLGTCSEASVTGSVSLLFEVRIEAMFRFKIRAGTDKWGFLKLKEFVTWIDETLESTSKVKATVNAVYSVSRTQSLVQKQLLIGLPTSIAGVGLDFGLFGNIEMQMHATIEGEFSAEFGVTSSRRKKYGAYWDPSKPGYYYTGTMVPINEDFPPKREKHFDWGGKVIAKLTTSLDLITGFNAGVSLGYLGSYGLELSAGLSLGLIAEFKYGIGNMILQPVVTTSHIFKANEEICQQRHRAEAHLNAFVTQMEVFINFNPFYSSILLPEKTLLDIPLFIGCWFLGGVDGSTQDYERIGDESSATFEDIESSFVAPVPAPIPAPACIVGIDCPLQPGACAQGHATMSVGHPCASGCAVGFGSNMQCQPSTCCKANAKLPPAHGEHKIVGLGSWTHQQLNVPGGMYTEVRCNAGYTLSGRNLGFQSLGSWPNCQGSCVTSGSSRCCYSLTDNLNLRPLDWPTASSFTPCVTESTSSGGRRSRISGRQWELNKSSVSTKGIFDGYCGFLNRLQKNGVCDEPSNCVYGTDEADCGPCRERPSCRDSCEHAYNGECDELSGLCLDGTDTTDCKLLPDNSCSHQNDGDCDEPDGLDLCDYYTDWADCGYCRQRASCKEALIEFNSCQYAYDGECDEPNFCAFGTDTTDCEEGSPPPPPPPPPDLQDCKFSQSIPADGSWKLEERSCSPVSCGVYPAPAYGTVSPAGARTYGQTVTITCNTGYELAGAVQASATPSCQANGLYTTGKQCALRTCAPFSAIPNGAAFPDTGVLSGQHVAVSCNNGYELTGDVLLLCDRGAYLFTNSPSCRQISCGLLSVENGHSTLPTATLFGNKAEIQCNAGFQFSSPTITAECRASGTFALSGSCAACLPGKFKVASGTAVCIDCPVGTYKNTSGTGSCISCPSNGVSQQGSLFCSCNAGYTGRNGGLCSACPAGKYKEFSGLGFLGSSLSTTMIFDSLYSFIGLAISAENGEDCTSCPRNAGSPQGSTSISACSCNAGHTGASCFACDAGKFKDVTGNAACVVCPAGKYAPFTGNDHGSDCIACPSGKYLATTGNDAATDCESCPRGKYSQVVGATAVSTCIPCPSGFSAAGSISVSDCVSDCVAGYTGLAGSCLACPTGTYKASSGSAGCTLCGANAHSDDEGSTACACNMGYGASAPGECAVCGAGKFKAVRSNDACGMCLAGKYKPHAGVNTQCNDCDFGTYKAEAGVNTACDNCEVGKFKASYGVNTACDNCEAGKYTIDVQATTCSNCEAGKHKTASGVNTVCDDCEAGKYTVDVQATACSNCEAGKYAIDVQATACSNCEAGKHKAVSGVNTACDHCEAGKYTVDVQATACSNCEAGKHKSSSYLNIECDLCVAGTYKAVSGVNVVCDVCEAGSYSSSAGASSCMNCASNSISETGSTVCLCNAGYSVSNDITCSACLAGHYKIFAGAGQCISCAPGKYSDVVGASNENVCIFCEAGKHSAAGSHVCVDDKKYMAALSPTPPPRDLADGGCVDKGCTKVMEALLIKAAQKYPNCTCTRSWREIRQSEPIARSGGLGQFMVEAKYEVWVCLQDNICSTLDDWFCYVFNEQTKDFAAWGFNSEVKAVKNLLK